MNQKHRKYDQCGLQMNEKWRWQFHIWFRRYLTRFSRSRDWKEGVMWSANPLWEFMKNYLWPQIEDYLWTQRCRTSDGNNRWRLLIQLLFLRSCRYKLEWQCGVLYYPDGRRYIWIIVLLDCPPLENDPNIGVPDYYYLQTNPNSVGPMQPCCSKLQQKIDFRNVIFAIGDLPQPEGKIMWM